MAGGGSHLRKLKETLKSHGLIGAPQQKKKQRGKTPREYNRVDRSELLKSIERNINQFDKKQNRHKRADFNPKASLGTYGNPTQSKQMDMDARKAAYLEEKSRKNKTGGIRDRRFGENDPTLAPEEKQLERFRKEKMNRASKRSIFNLDDDDDDDDEVHNFTHYGQTLALEDDDFNEDDMMRDESETELSNKKRRLVEERDDEVNDEPERKKTKAEVMKEVIAKSKKYKAARQQLKEDDLEKTQKLDDDLGDLLSSLQPTQKGPVQKPEFTEKDKEYDVLVKELGFDKRAKPSERTKSKEELEQEEAEKLARLEKARLARMNGEDLDDLHGDDLGVDFWEDLADKDDGMDSNDEAELNDKEASGDHTDSKKVSKEETISTDEHNIPYVFPIPSDYKEFNSIFEKYPCSKHPIIIERILTTHKPSLRAGNKEKIGIFTTVLLEHILKFSNRELDKSEDETSVRQSIINKFIELSQEYVELIAKAFKTQLLKTEKRIFNSKPLKKSDLILFSLIGMVFSTSDKEHFVTLGAQLAMGQFLTQIHVTDSSSLLAGLYLCQIFHQYQRISKRYVPEVQLFLQKALFTFITNSDDLDKSLISLPNEFQKSDFKLTPKKLSKKTSKLISLSASYYPKESKKDSKLPARLFYRLIEVIDIFLSHRKESLAFLEITEPLMTYFSVISKQLSSSSIDITEFSDLQNKLTNLRIVSQKARTPLALQKLKPEAIQTKEPKFNMNSNPESKGDLNDEQRELTKLNALIKKAKKSNLREIRSENKFLAATKLEERKR